MKTLNLDVFAKVERTLTLGGVTYDVKEMTVDGFIEATKQADQFEAKEEVSIIDSVKASISMIQRSVPECPEAALRGMTIEQLVMVSKFLRGDLDDQVVMTPEGEEKK